MTPVGRLFMKKTLLLLALSIAIICTISTVSVSAHEANNSTYNIEVTTRDEDILVKEKIEIKGDIDGIYQNLSFWIPVNSADKITILVNNNQPQFQEVT